MPLARTPSTLAMHGPMKVKTKQMTPNLFASSGKWENKILMETWTITIADKLCTFLNPKIMSLKFLKDAEKKKINLRQCGLYQ